MVLHEYIILLSLWVNEKQNRATCVTGADYMYYHRESPCQPQVQEVEPLKHDFLMSATGTQSSCQPYTNQSGF